LLECVIEAAAPAHTVIIWTYLSTTEDTTDAA
jgi:uncharacterized protein YmfQ (DUF2313 family)